MSDITSGPEERSTESSTAMAKKREVEKERTVQKFMKGEGSICVMGWESKISLSEIKKCHLVWYFCRMGRISSCSEFFLKS